MAQGRRRSRAGGSSLNANLGLVQHDSGNHKAALVAFDEALHVRRGIGDVVGGSSTLDSLGIVAQAMGDDDRALARFQEALDAAKETGDRNRISLILTAHLQGRPTTGGATR